MIFGHFAVSIGQTLPLVERGNKAAVYRTGRIGAPLNSAQAFAIALAVFDTQA